MYVIMGIHHVKPGMEKGLIELQERFGKAQQGHKGLIAGFIWKDEKTGVVIGTALWDTKEDYDAARPDMDKAIEGVDFRIFDSSIEIYRGSPVAWTA